MNCRKDGIKMKDKMIKVGLFCGGAVVGAISFSILRDKFEYKAIDEILALHWKDKSNINLKTLERLRTIKRRYYWSLSPNLRRDLDNTIILMEECIRRHQNRVRCNPYVCVYY